jgi:hypothetical protein
MASQAPVVIAAAVNKARREITAHFMQMNAIAPGDAVAFVPERLIVRRQFEKMLAKGVVKQAGKGLYWLDIPAYNAETQSRRARLVPVVIVVALIIAAVITLGYRG